MEATVEEKKFTVAEYDPIAAALATLWDRYQGAVFDVTTKPGLEQAKQARAELRGYRTNLESVRKSIKAPALEKCRLIDAEAKEITEKLSALEDPIAAQIKVEEERAEAERAAKLKAEISRINGIRGQIAEIASAAEGLPANKSKPIEQAIIRTKAIEITEASFQEFTEEATRAKESALFRLQNLLVVAMNAEAEADRNRRDREELDKLRAADEARRRTEEEDRLQREAVERAHREAEDKARREQIAREDAERKARQDEEDRQRREAQAAEQARIDEEATKVRREREAIEAKERFRREAEQAERQRIEDEEKARERAEQEKAEAADRKLRNSAHALLAAGQAIMTQYDASPDCVLGGELTNGPFLMMREAIQLATE